MYTKYSILFLKKIMFTEIFLNFFEIISVFLAFAVYFSLFYSIFLFYFFLIYEKSCLPGDRFSEKTAPFSFTPITF
jgi:hypothetical protein